MSPLSPLPALRRIRIAQTVYILFVISCVSRMVMLGIPGIMGYDELFAFSASNYPAPHEFIHGSWVERWMVLETYSYGRTLWTLGHLMFGYVFNATTNPSYPFTAVCGIITLLFVAGMGRNLWGRKGLLLFMLFGALSPYMLNYTARSMGVMPAVMFLSAALYFLTLRGWTVKQWILGGLCLGLSFTTHYGSGQAILSIGIGFALIIPIRLFRRGASIGQKLSRYLCFPLLGAIFAVAPIAILEGWARYAGSSYLKRLLTHESVGRDAYAGPYGLWLRIAFEFEPIFLVLLVMIGSYVFISPQFTKRAKVLLGMAGVVATALILNSLFIPYWRSHAAWALLIALGGVAVAFRWPEKLMDITDNTSDGLLRNSPDDHFCSPFDASTLIVAFIALACINTPMRTMSMMTRQIFCMWPLTALLMGTLIFWAWPRAWIGVMRLIIIIGGAFFVLGWLSVYHAKAIQPREHMIDWNYPGRHSITWLELILYENGWERLRQRGNDDVHDVPTTKYVYPALIYDEEYYMPQYLRAKLVYADAAHLVTPQNLVCGSIRIDIHQPGQVPPAYALIIPDEFEMLDSQDQPIDPHLSEARGIEMRFSGAIETREETYKLRVSLPAEPGKSTQFGFQALTIAPFAPQGTQVNITIYHEGETLHHVVMHPTDTYQGQYHIHQATFTPKKAIETLEIEALLIRPTAEQGPPVSLYLRRPFIVRPFEIPTQRAIAAVGEVIKADEIIAQEILTPEYSTPMARSYSGESGSGSITWQSAPWSGDSSEVLAFVLAYSPNIKLRLYANQESIADISLPDQWGVDIGRNNFIVRHKYFAGGPAFNENFAIRVPKGFAPTNVPIEFRLEIIESDQANGWIGVRQLDDANLVLSNMNL